MARVDNLFRVLIKPFDEDGNLVADFIDVSRFVEGIGTLSEDTDSSDFSTGVFRTSNVTINLNNRDGSFSDVDIEQSIFRFTRSNSLVRIVFSLLEEGSLVGQSFIDEGFISDDLVVFEGLLDDDALKLDADDETVKFKVLGKEAILGRLKISPTSDSTGFTIPFSDFTGSDLISDLIFKILNRAKVTDLFTVSAGNINPGIDQIPDDLNPLLNLTGREALQRLLVLSNSVLYIKNDAIFVTDRAAGASVAFTFFGQASQQGAENVEKINKISSGKHRTFNFATWKDNSAARFTNNDSVAIHGSRKQELDFEEFTDTVKQVNIQEAIVNEFKLPKQEFELLTKADYPKLALNLLDKVKVDYPTVFVEQDFPLPICGLVVCGEGVLPLGLWSFSVPASREYKIIKKQVDPRNIQMIFKLREA